MNPKALEQAMKKMGIKQENLDANEVIIKLADKQLIFRNPDVVKVNMMGQESYQIVGKPEEKSLARFNHDDVKIVMQQADVDELTAIKALEKEGDIAAAILYLKNQ